MKTKYLATLSLVLLCGLAACGSPAEAPTVAPSATPSRTPIPRPTATDTPVPTATIVPDVVSQSFDGIALLHEENFDAAELPADWSGGRVSENGELVVEGRTPAIYKGLLIGLSQGFVGRIMASPLADFYIGLEGAPDGDILPRYSANSSAFVFDMETPRGFSSQIWRANDFGFLPYGESLVEGTWYNIALGIDQTKNLRIRVWNDDQQFFFDHPLEAHPFPPEDLADNFRFVIAVRNGGTVYFDDLKFFKFESFTN
jgi:hypothetical protein